MEVLYRDDYDLPLATAMHDALAEIMPGIRSRGLKNDVEDLHRQLTVLDSLVLPACLIEVGFISNEGDRNELLKVTQVAEALSTGVARYSAENGNG
jgi:N-acetylmuramoyl-L-alanine amidase